MRTPGPRHSVRDTAARDRYGAAVDIVYGLVDNDYVFLPADAATEWAEGRAKYEHGPGTLSIDLLGEELEDYGYESEPMMDAPGLFIPQDEVGDAVAHLESLGHAVRRDDDVFSRLKWG